MRACSPGYVTPEGYRQVSVKHPRLYPKARMVLEHRLTIELFLGRRLKRNEWVHHKDGNKLNNNLSNLQLISPLEHNRHHAVWEEHRPPRVICICQRCGAHTELPPSLARKNKYCSEACRLAALHDSLRVGRPETPCEVCGTMIQQTKNVHNQRKYCSPACRSIGRGASVSAAKLQKEVS